jgi:tetratricopeptide (TPR) repeat protein
MNLTPEIIDEEGKDILFARVASELLNKGKVDQATLISEVGIKKLPNYAQGHYVLGKCYQIKDMYEEARAEYERVLRYDSSHLGAMKELAGLYNSTGLNDVYKDYLYRLLTLDPLNTKILDECKEQGVYEIWKTREELPLTTKESIEPIKNDKTGFSIEEESKSIEKEVESEKKNAEDLLKIDLTQFENQADDFTTIMDGLIQESSEEGKDVDATNYLKDLESPAEIENELLAEEKPIEDSIDELDVFEKGEILEDSKSTFLELDYSQNDEKKAESEVNASKLNKEEETISIKKEIQEEPEQFEKAFDEPKLRIENIEVKDDPQQNNVHDKTELIFEEKDDNVELEFEEGHSNEDIKTKTEQNELPVLDDEEKSEIESPYIKQKIVSQTLGEILVSQNKYREAKQVFLALKKQQPDNPNIDKKLEILEKIIALEEKKTN